VKYQDMTKAILDARTIERPPLSVIAVTYERPRELGMCLDSLRKQTRQDFEVIIVNNGGSIVTDGWKNRLSAVCVHLRKNYGCIVGRNLGSEMAKGEVLYFIDDDVIVGPETVEALISFFKSKPVVAIRGRILPKTRSVFNNFAAHYDLGDGLLEGQWQEGNGAIRREAFQAIGGYDEQLPSGHEGAYLLYKLLMKWGKERVVYLPSAVVQHDYALSAVHYFKKKMRHGQSRAIQEKRYPDMVYYLRSSKTINNAHGKSASQIRANGFPTRLLHKLLRRAGAWCYSWGYSYGKLVA
jgi:GT2 family glycosyltransferase